MQRNYEVLKTNLRLTALFEGQRRAKLLQRDYAWLCFARRFFFNFWRWEWND